MSHFDMKQVANTACFSITLVDLCKETVPNSP